MVRFFLKLSARPPARIFCQSLLTKAHLQEWRLGRAEAAGVHGACLEVEGHVMWC